MAVQVAFQGGGAKFCDLLAAAEALQSLSEEIQVTRVAGTSAGAIVACLFEKLAPGETVGILIDPVKTHA